MRFIDLKKAENNNQIKGISVVCRHRVIWEKPRKQSEPIQCHRCQGYGHTKHIVLGTTYAENAEKITPLQSASWNRTRPDSAFTVVAPMQPTLKVAKSTC